jgi:hypothetical protein
MIWWVPSQVITAPIRIVTPTQEKAHIPPDESCVDMGQGNAVSGLIIGALVAILVGVVVYSSLGVLVESSGIIIYDTFPVKPAFMGGPVSISVSNDAPLTLPLFSPTYSVSVLVVSNSSEIECMLSTGKGDLPCRSVWIDLGRIAPSESKSAFVTVHTNGNFTLRVMVDMNFFTNFQIKTKLISCQVQSTPPSAPVYSCP